MGCQETNNIYGGDACPGNCSCIMYEGSVITSTIVGGKEHYNHSC